VLVHDLVRQRQRITHLHIDTEFAKLADDIDHLRIANVRDVLLEGNAEHGHDRLLGRGRLEHPRALARDVRAHHVIDAAPRKNDLRKIAGLLCPVRQVIRVDADAVPADQARLKGLEVPFGPSRRQYVPGVDPEPVEDRRQFVHESDVEVTLRVFDDLRGFRHLDRRRAVNAGLDHRAIDVRDDVERTRVLAGYDLHDAFEAVLPVAWIDALGRIAEREVAAAHEARGPLQNRRANL